MLQGSRVSHKAKLNESDIDIALRVDNATFFDLAEESLANAPLGTKLRAKKLRRIRTGQLSTFDLGTEFRELREELVDSRVPFAVQFSVLRMGSKLDTAPQYPINKGAQRE